MESPPENLVALETIRDQLVAELHHQRARHDASREEWETDRGRLRAQLAAAEELAETWSARALIAEERLAACDGSRDWVRSVVDRAALDALIEGDGLPRHQLAEIIAARATDQLAPALEP
ncbi:MAG TPA: hypothetical protein VK571_06980 [Gemmatimonadaceae bacterium]|nr:hypothetical protein [Gemmatimonadaceae bacterium]